MFLLYIDDSFFGRSEYARDMRYKLQVILKETPLNEVLISNRKTSSNEIDRFFKEFPDVKVYMSTDRYQIAGREWILSNASLRVESLQLRPYAGTYCLIDPKTLDHKRIYLDLFPQEETDLVTILQEMFQLSTSAYEDKN